MTENSRGVSRRRILQGMGLLAASSLIPLSIAPAFADAAPANGDFIEMSKYLTGRETLPADFSAALFAAFSKIDDNFTHQLSQLRTYISQHAIKAASLKTALAADPSASALVALPSLILNGWYLGVAGSGDKALCVAYIDALANQDVADILRPPSYAYGAYGSWAAKPF